MPNHVANVIRMKGIKALPLFSATEDGVLYFDFNKLIPMPESVNVESGSTEELAIEAVMRECGKSRISCWDYKKMPEEDWESKVIRPGRDIEKLQKLGLQYISNKVLHEETAWYDLCCDQWGTKWNAYEFEVEDDDTIRFQTAWSCPEPILAKLAEMYPETRIEHWWADECSGSNCGYMLYENGQVSGGYDDPFSSDAYGRYVFCWGDSCCIYQDEVGSYCHRDCDTCHGCD